MSPLLFSPCSRKSPIKNPPMYLHGLTTGHPWRSVHFFSIQIKDHKITVPPPLKAKKRIKNSSKKSKSSKRKTKRKTADKQSVPNALESSIKNQISFLKSSPNPLKLNNFSEPFSEPLFFSEASKVMIWTLLLKLLKNSPLNLAKPSSRKAMKATCFSSYLQENMNAAKSLIAKKNTWKLIFPVKLSVN